MAIFLARGPKDTKKSHSYNTLKWRQDMLNQALILYNGIGNRSSDCFWLAMVVRLTQEHAITFDLNS